MEEIRIRDVYLREHIERTLQENGKRDSRYKGTSGFSLEELSTITTLTLKGRSVKDISVLKYCTNLKELSIISANPKINGGYNVYKKNMHQIEDFSVIGELTNLDDLTIVNDWNLSELDVSNLKNLTSLTLRNNPNLTEIKGLEKTNIAELTEYRNGNLKPFDLQSIMNGSLHSLYLDFDMYPLIKKTIQI